MSAHPPRVGYPLDERKFGVSGQPNHRACAQLLLEILHGRAAELSRVTGGRWSERMVQYWMESQGPHESPPEQARRFLSALRDVVGQHAAERVADWICAGLGGRFERIETPAERVATIKDRLIEAARSKAGLEEICLERLLDGHVSAEDVLAYQRAVRELRADFDALDRAVLWQHEKDNGKDQPAANVARITGPAREGQGS